MREIDASRAKTLLSKLLDQVVQGERIAITRDGRRVAMLIPVELETELSPTEAVKQLRSLRAGITWSAGPSIREAIDEGWR